MSIHRPKRATSRRSEAPGAGGRSSSPSSAPKPEGAFVAYAQGLTFAKDTLVNHAKFGKGLVVEVDGNKLHVLFEEGIRKLLHGTPG